MLGKLHKWILIMKKLIFFFNYFFVNLIDFVYLIQIMFLEYLYSVDVLTSNVNKSDVAIVGDAGSAQHGDTRTG